MNAACGPRSIIASWSLSGALGLGQHQGADAPAQDLVAHGGEVKGDEQQREGKRHDSQWYQHARINRRSAHAEDRGGLVQRVPPVYRELDDRQIDGADQSQDCRSAAGAAWIIDGAPQGHHGEVHDEKHQHRGQPRVPDPIGAPHRPAPERSGHERQERKGGPERSRALGGHVRERMAPHQRAERRSAHHAPHEHAQPRIGDVNEHDLDGGALLIVVRRQVRAPQSACERDQGRGDKPRQHAFDKRYEAGRISKIDQRHGRVPRDRGKTRGSLVARMERSAIRDTLTPDYAGAPSGLRSKNRHDFCPSYRLTVPNLPPQPPNAASELKDIANQLDYSMPYRSVAAAAKGPITPLMRVSAHRIVNGVSNGTGPATAALVAATPKISTGTVSGSTSTGSKRPPRRSAVASAAPTTPMKVNAGVPTRSVSPVAARAVGSRFRKRPRMGEATTSGRPVVTQCAKALAATTSSSGSRVIRMRSREPSS